MVPARLVLRNFLCYRDCPPLDLEGIHVACLTGDNGNGKSALLDAITWALWGKARSNRDGELVSLGASEMEVELEFLAGPDRYRVIRKWRRVGARGGSSGLELQLRDGETWRVLSGSTMAETDRAIQSLLKLSYDTFINSSFLVQGKSGLFTAKTAAERKAVLGEILDLGRYDGWEAQSRLLLRDAQERTGRHQDAIVSLEAEATGLQDSVFELPRLVEGVAALQEQLQFALAEQQRLMGAVRERQRLTELRAEALRRRDTAARQAADARAGAAQQAPLVERHAAVLAREAAITEGFAALQVARRDEQSLRAEQQRLEAERRAAEREAARIADQRRRVESAEQDSLRQTAAFQAQLAGAAEVRSQYAALQQARRVQTEQAPLAQRLAALEQQRAGLTQAITAARRQLELRIDAAKRERLQPAALVAERPELEQRLAVLRRDDEQTAALRRALLDAQQGERERREEHAALTAENSRLRTEMDALKQRVNQLDEAERREQVDCPLCRSPLGRDGLLRVREEYAAQGSELAGRFRANKPRLLALEAEAQAEAQKAQRLTLDLERHTGARRQETGEVQARLAAATQAGERLVAVDAELTALRAAQAAGDGAGEERRQLAQTEQAIASLGFDRAAYDAALAQVQELTAADAAHRALTRAEDGLIAATQAYDRLQDERRALTAQGEEVAERLTTLLKAAAALPLVAAAEAVAALRLWEVEQQQLEQARGGIGPARAALYTYQQSEHQADETRREAEQRIAEADTGLAALPEGEEALAHAQAAVGALQGRLHILQQELGRAKGDVQRLEGLQARLRDLRQLLESAQREAGIYTELAQAFGKRGVQGMLIETVLPEIEQAANELLARMTNNRMHLTLEAVRTTQKGDPMETLDVRIADEWGTRPYELFSGGEAFRIDLALRIALSKLLARRAGAPLATLVIDEGFGTQDAAGRERLIEAITAIQDHFQCLLLVTHISELKEQFDTRIEVVKSGEGSVARVVVA